MLRDKSLIPLSHQHQHALALCVRIERASPIAGCDLEAWQSEVAQLGQMEIAIHFAAEEQVVFPAARGFGELVPLVEELLADHTALRESFAGAASRTIAVEDLLKFAQRLSSHIRKEERQLFERMQQLMSQKELGTLGEEVADSLKDAAQACVLPNSATALRPAR
ncbi:MAG TPA: hemerythrin domain-containing protein [Terriglobales bacterium]|nr:hemerythrin domain-containing protein [Terriglobales bacterium]